MKNFFKKSVIAGLLLSVFVFSGCDIYSYGTSATQTNYENPQWAPPYYNGAHYYYLPDIESYYDLSSREFVCLSNGQWVYSQNLPSIYADFGLNNCFAVVVNVDVYQPWMHHQYYISHYPRYYYRDYYDHSNIPYVRGFIENNKSAIYWNENEREHARSWDNANLKTSRQFKYTKDDRQQQSKWNNQNQGNVYNNRNNQNNSETNKPTSNYNKNNQNNQPYSGTTRPSNDNGFSNNRNIQNNATNTTDNTTTGRSQNTYTQGSRTTTEADTNIHQRNTTTTVTDKSVHNTNYYGKTIGQPVRVEKQMRQQNSANSNSRRENDQNNQGGQNRR